MKHKKLLLTTALLALLGGGIYAGSGYAVKPLATQFIRQNGFPTATIGQISLTPQGAMVDKIALDGNEFTTVEGIAIGFRWMDFLKTRAVQSLSIKDITVTCELDEGGNLKIAGWDASTPHSSTGSALLPVQSLILQGVTFDCETNHGNVRLEGKLSVSTPNANEQILNYALWGRQHQLGFDAKGTGKLSANGDILLSATMNDGRANLADFEISRASGWIDYTQKNDSSPAHIAGQIIAGKINLQKNILLQNVTVTVDTAKPEALFFKTSPAGYNDITLTGRWITSPHNQIEAYINSASSLNLLKLLAPDKVQDWKPWIEGANPLSLTLRAPFEALTADKKAADFTLNIGAPSSRYNLATSGTALYQQSNPITQLSFNQSVVSIAGGTVNVTPFAIASNYQGTPPLKLSLGVHAVDMAALSKIADIDGLKANGRLSGTIPLTYSTKGITFGKSTLKSDKGGTFAYKPAQFPSSLAGEDERMKTVQQALGDFHFSILDMELSGDMDGKMKTTLKAEGTSPAFGDRPIKLNLNLDGDLGKVVKQALQAGDISDTLRSTVRGAQK